MPKKEKSVRPKIISTNDLHGTGKKKESRIAPIQTHFMTKDGKLINREVDNGQ